MAQDQHPDPSRHRPEDSPEPKVQCEVCLREIPESEAKSSEADEYTRYFCGLECYEHWRKKDEQREGD